MSKLWYLKIIPMILFALAITASLFWATQSYLCGSLYNIFDELSCPTPIELVRSAHNRIDAENGDAERVRALISSGLGPSEANEMLIAAISQGHEHTARLLIESGITRTASDDKHGPSALDMAASTGNFNIAKLLLANGANPNGHHPPSELAALRSRNIAVPDFFPGETPFYRAMDCLLQPELNYIARARGPEGCLQVATLLAEKGATMVGGQAIDQTIGKLRGDVRWKAVTILLAVADHSGRFQEALQRMLDATDPIQSGNQVRANPAADFRPTLEAIARCPQRRLVPATDHFELCAKN